MKLYVMPGSCALACHIALEWAKAPYELEVLTHDALRSEQFLAVNPKAKVPALVLDKNDVITEAQAILLLIADLFPDAGLAPPASDLVRRAKLNETLSELTSEVHPAYGPLFAPSRYAAEPGCEEAVKRAACARVDACFVRLDAALEGKDWLLGERSVADPYLYALSRWLKMTPNPVESYPAIARHFARMASDPYASRALAAEGLDA
jgi:glutathione S-transferase